MIGSFVARFVRGLRARPRWAPWIVFLLAGCLRWAALERYEARYPLAQVPVIDERSYERWALEIAAGDWIGSEVFFQEPLYPYFVGAVYAVVPGDAPARGTLRRIQVLLGAATAALAFLLGRMAFGAGAGWVAGLLLALHGPAVLLPAYLLKPNLFLPICGLLLLCLLGALRPDEKPKAGLWLAVGLLAGLGALLRGNLLLLLPWILLTPCFLRLGNRMPSSWAGTLRQCLLVLLGTGTILLPVALRNYRVGGVFALTTSGAGTNVYGGNNLDNPYGRATEFDWVRGIPEYEAGDWRREAERRAGRPLDPKEVSGFWLGETWRSMRADPLAHARILWNKLRLCLSAYEVPDNHSYDWDRQHLGAVAVHWAFDWRLLGGLGLAGLLIFLATRPRPRAGWVLLVGFGLYLVTIVATVVSMRVRLALCLPLAPFAGLLVVRAPGLFSSGAPGRLGLLAALTLGFLPALWPVFDRQQVDADLDKRDFNWAVHLEAQPAGLAQALGIARALDAKHPGSTRVMNLLSQLEASTGFAALNSPGEAERKAAQDLISAALRRLGAVATATGTNPRERFRARASAGWIQLQLGRGESAERHFRAALEFDPESSRLLAGLAQALLLEAESESDPARLQALRAEAAQVETRLRAVAEAPGTQASKVAPEGAPWDSAGDD